MKASWNVIAIWALLFLVTACQSTPQAPSLLTGVHLQARFDIPGMVEGRVASHSEMDYLLYLPEGYRQDPDKLWPMIFFLHGAGSSVNDSAFMMSYGLPEVLYKGEQPEDFSFIVVSPQAFPNTPWWEGDTLAILNALLDEAINTYQVDPDRVYLTGLSMGGYGSWFLATAYPDRFAAMASIAGSGYRTTSIPGPETLCQLKDIPVWVIHGAQDDISDPFVNKVYMLSLAECGGEVEWTLYPDAGHGETYRRAYREPELYTWMLEHSR